MRKHNERKKGIWGKDKKVRRIKMRGKVETEE